MGGLENDQRIYFIKLNVTALQAAAASCLYTAEFSEADIRSAGKIFLAHIGTKLFHLTLSVPVEFRPHIHSMFLRVRF
jgi:hypothetical protein